MNSPVYASATLSQQLAHCAAAVAEVRAGRSLTDVLDRLPAERRAATQALSFHVMRWMGAAEVLRERLAPRRPEPALDALLISALALLWPPSQPPYAAHTLVDEAVKAARRQSARHGGFVNAVLRRCLRELEWLQPEVLKDVRARSHHPAWWAEHLQTDWGIRADALLKQAQSHPPMSLRVNTRRVSVAQYLQCLQEAGYQASQSTHPALDQWLQLAEPVPVARLPGFAEGWVSVQDAHAQCAAAWLLEGADTRGWRVLDACAAPGGKTAHLLERGDLDLLALDLDAGRMRRVADNLSRLGLNAELRAADASQPDDWWDGKSFDAILLDAPCSASGIVRRHPDIRWLRRSADLPALAATQLRLLTALWPLLKPGGRLLYATCSVFKAEGQHVLDAFRRQVGAAVKLLPHGSPGHLLPGLLPGCSVPSATPAPAPDGDGFFYALLAKACDAAAP